MFTKVKEVTDVGIESLSNLPELKYLDLSLVDITDVGLSSLANLPKLEKLDLFLAKRITDKPFSKMTNLRRLHVSACDSIKSDGLAELLETSSRIEFLKISLYDRRQEALKIIDAGFKSKRDKLIITVDGELHIGDKREGSCKYTMSKLDGQITKRRIQKFCTYSIDEKSAHARRAKNHTSAAIRRKHLPLAKFLFQSFEFCKFFQYFKIF